jgi:hypothetical protein
MSAQMKAWRTETAGAGHAIQIVEDCYLVGRGDSPKRSH